MTPGLLKLRTLEEALEGRLEQPCVAEEGVQLDLLHGATRAQGLPDVAADGQAQGAAGRRQHRHRGAHGHALVQGPGEVQDAASLQSEVELEVHAQDLAEVHGIWPLLLLLLRRRDGPQRGLRRPQLRAVDKLPGPLVLVLELLVPADRLPHELRHVLQAHGLQQGLGVRGHLGVLADLSLGPEPEAVAGGEQQHGLKHLCEVRVVGGLRRGVAGSLARSGSPRAELLQERVQGDKL
mmetsp:Transcript_119149/g.384726  ORF Transcript_119149/g.384726 Transcript_119149/m.384726 type:complete len:237 (+) Transcript_119149:824-1534(+)